MRKALVLPILFGVLMALSLFAGSSNASLQAEKLSLDSSSGTVGFDVSGYAYQLTDGSAYLIVAVVASTNYTAITSGSGTDFYWKIALSSVTVSSSTTVPIHIGVTTDGATTTTYDTTVYYTLNPASIPGQNFFTGIIGPLIIIGVVVGLASMFVMRRKMRG